MNSSLLSSRPLLYFAHCVTFTLACGVLVLGVSSARWRLLTALSQRCDYRRHIRRPVPVTLVCTRTISSMICAPSSVRIECVLFCSVYHTIYTESDTIAQFAIFSKRAEPGATRRKAFSRRVGDLKSVHGLSRF